MLVLSRRQGERIVIGDEVVITLIAVKGGRARIGIEAPMEVPVLRQELQANGLHEESFGRPAPATTA